MIFPYNFNSESAKNLASALGVKRIKTEGSKFKGSEGKLVINWGSSDLPIEVEKSVVVNSSKSVKVASNKLSFFGCVEGLVQIPEFTTDKEVAKGWVDSGKIVVARSKLNGHSGDGIYIIEDQESWNSYNHGSFKIYVMYIPKKEEYRVHVVDGKVIDIRRKALRKDFEGKPNFKVRNHNQGFNFVKDGFEAPEQVLSQSVLATQAVGLDFGAVDVIYNNFHEKAFVLEINTAPGLEGSSVDNYAAAFQTFYDRGPKGQKYRRMELDQEMINAKAMYFKEKKKGNPFLQPVEQVQNEELFQGEQF